MEMDQNDLALAITGRPQGLQYSALVMHEYAQRVHRKDFVEQIVRQCFDFFQGHPERQTYIQKAADAEAKEVEDTFIARNCGEYQNPKFDFYIHAPDYE